MTTTTEHRTLTLTQVAQCIAHLAALDPDRAWEENGQGFAKNDVGIGHELAQTPLNEWDDEMLWWAYERCRKYRRQVADAYGDGFFERIPAPRKVVVEVGERFWERRRREKRLAEESTYEKAQRVERERRANEAADRAAAKAAELTKPRTITLLHATDKYTGEQMVRFDYPFVWQSEITERCMAQIKALPKRFFNGDNPQDKHWRAPVNLANIDALLALLDDGWASADATDLRALFVGAKRAQQVMLVDKVIATKTREQTDALNRVASKAEDADFHVPGLLREPYPFQRAGIAFIAREKRVLVADQPGLGKTIQAIGGVQHLGAYPVLVVCPSAVKYNWEREWHATVGGKRVVVLDGKKAAPLASYRGAEVVICNYDILGAHSIAIETEVRPKSIIVDESHYIKNKKAERTQQVKLLAKKTDVRLLLTGTPVLNKPVDLLSQLEVLDRVNDIARDTRPKPRAEWTFLNRYCGAYQDAWGWHFDGATHTDELNDRLVSTCMVRRMKTNVLKELPPKTRTIIEVDLTNRAEYDRAEKDLVAYLAGQAVEDAEFRRSLAGLSPEEAFKARQARYSESSQRTRAAEHLVRFNALKQLATKGKMKAITAWVEDFLASGNKLVTMAWHRETVETLAAQFKAPTVMGGATAQKKQAAIDAFQRDPSVKVIACNIIAAGEGITLTASSDTLFCELGWNPGKMEQAEDRIHRIGQKSEQVNCWYVLAKDTIDTMLWKIIEDKRRVVNAVVDGVTIEGEDGSVMDALVQSMLGGFDDKGLKKLAKGAK